MRKVKEMELQQAKAVKDQQAQQAQQAQHQQVQQFHQPTAPGMEPPQFQQPQLLPPGGAQMSGQPGRAPALMQPAMSQQGMMSGQGPMFDANGQRCDVLFLPPR